MIVVITGLMQNFSFMTMGGSSILRTFRLFRPLRSLSIVPSMKLLVDTLFKSIGKLTNIIILDTYFILTFAIFGLQMYEGVTHYRCRETKHPVFYEDTQMWDWRPVEDDHRICGSFHQCEHACGSLYELELTNQNNVQD